MISFQETQNSAIVVMWHPMDTLTVGILPSIHTFMAGQMPLITFSLLLLSTPYFSFLSSLFLTMPRIQFWHGWQRNFSPVKSCAECSPSSQQATAQGCPLSTLNWCWLSVMIESLDFSSLELRMWSYCPYLKMLGYTNHSTSCKVSKICKWAKGHLF